VSKAVTKQAEKQPVPAARLKFLLSEQSIKARFEDVLGKRAPAFLSSIVSATSANRALAECDPMSVISAAMIAASMDLPINPSLGFAHIVPYKGVAQFQIGYKGFIQLAMRSGQYKTINLTPVREGELKRWDRFTGEMVFDATATSDVVVGYLLYFKLLNGFEKYFYMTREEIMAHGKEYSASFKKGFGMWVDDFDAMALKTVAKLGLSKFGILSVEMQKAVHFDQGAVPSLDATEPVFLDRIEGPKPAEDANASVAVHTKGRTSRLDSIVEAQDIDITSTSPVETPPLQTEATPEVVS
jgi:recombination protein RecT